MSLPPHPLTLLPVTEQQLRVAVIGTYPDREFLGQRASRLYSARSTLEGGWGPGKRWDTGTRTRAPPLPCAVITGLTRPTRHPDPHGKQVVGANTPLEIYKGGQDTKNNQLGGKQR